MNKRQLIFTPEDIKEFLAGDYFEVYRAEEREITVMSKNTEDFWDLTIFQNKIELRHKHKLNHRYHKDEWHLFTLKEAKREIIKHDLFVMNDRKPIDRKFLEHILKFYGV